MGLSLQPLAYTQNSVLVQASVWGYSDQGEPEGRRKEKKRLHLTQILKFSLDERTRDYGPRLKYALSTRT